MDALSEALSKLDQGIVKKEIGKYVPVDVQKILAGAGIRDEHVFPVPAVIRAGPSLIGYYRLLLGIPQKGFYSGATGMSAFKSMEEHNTASAKHLARIPDFCLAMAGPLAELVRQVSIALSHDPDVAIDEMIGDGHRKVAIEVKGGTDVSNAHNRAGEAEKSHLKAKGRGYPEFWTVISKTGLDMVKLKAESQTTHLWFDVAQVLARKGRDWDDFCQRLAGAVGIPIPRIAS